MAKEKQAFFVGFSSLEGLVAALNKAKPVYASALQVVVSGASSPVETRKQVVMVSQIVENEVRYVRFPVGYEQYFNGQPWNPDHEERREGFIETYTLVEAWLKEQGFAVADATVSHPKGMELVDGDIKFLEYNKATKRYYRKG